MIKVMVKINFAILLLSKLCNSMLPGVFNNPCDSTGTPNVDEGVIHVDRKSKILQKLSVLQIQNVKFTPASLSGNARSASNARLVSCLPQNTRSAFCQFQNVTLASLVLNTRSNSEVNSANVESSNFCF